MPVVLSSMSLKAMVQLVAVESRKCIDIFLTVNAYRRCCRFSLNTSLANHIITENIKLAKKPNSDAAFLTAWLMKLIDSEKSLWRWRGAQSNPPPADYNARDAHSETAEVVPMPVIGGELGLQSIMHNALIELANMFVAEKDNLAGDKWKGGDLELGSTRWIGDRRLFQLPIRRDKQHYERQRVEGRCCEGHLRA